MSTRNRKLIVILGPTASGKSDLAVRLAQKFDGEVVSADSRQIYRSMDIGSGKITPDTKNSSNFSTGQAKKKYIFTHKGIPHYCIDVASPKKRFTVAQYQKLAWKAIKDIWKRGKLPILCGGTGLYIQSIVDDLVIPEVPPDAKLRKKLEKLSAEGLFKKLKKIDPRRAKNIDRHNRRRLIRALEIVIKTGKPVPLLKTTPLSHPELVSGSHRRGGGNDYEMLNQVQHDKKFNILQLGIARPKNQLATRIKKRLCKRLKQGMVAEVKKLRKQGVSWKRLEEFGLEYRAIAQYLQNKITRQEMAAKVQKESEQYAKRQMTWFSAHGGSASGGKRDKRIKWIRNYKEAENLTKKFLK